MSVVLTEDLRQRIASNFMQHGALANVFLFDQIPQKKLQNATRSFARGMGSDETVIVLYDDTVFGSSKEGFILTTRRLYGKNIMERGMSVEIADIRNVTLEPGIAPEAHAHTTTGILKKQLTVSDSNGQSGMLFNALRDTISLLQNPNGVPGAQAQNTAAAGDTVRCDGCGAVGPAGTCEYCGSPMR